MTSQEGGYRRWYDHEPVLSNALILLKEAPDAYQAQIALNIIKIIVEHQIEGETSLPVDVLEHFLADPKCCPGMSQKQSSERRRWYDVNQTLHSAIEMIKDCPPDHKDKVVPLIATMIEKTLQVNPSEV